MSEPFWFNIPINPEPWAIGPVGYARRQGKMSAYVGQNKQLAAFQEAVREEASLQWGTRPPLEGELRLDIWFWRQRAAYSTPSARRHRKHEADATNLLKATEDALQGVVFKNDRDNLSVHSTILVQAADVPFGQIIVRVEQLEPDWRAAELKRIPGEVMSMRMQRSNSRSNNLWPPWPPPERESF